MPESIEKPPLISPAEAAHLLGLDHVLGHASADITVMERVG